MEIKAGETKFLLLWKQAVQSKRCRIFAITSVMENSTEWKFLFSVNLHIGRLALRHAVFSLFLPSSYIYRAEEFDYQGVC